MLLGDDRVCHNTKGVEMLTDMYSLVESVVGSTLIIWGLIFIVNRHIIQSFFDTFTNVEKNETFIYLIACMFLILGLITVFVHNDWHWGFTVIVTLMGWYITITSVLWLLFPRFLANLIKKFSPLVYKTWFGIACGVISMALGLLIMGKHYTDNLVTWLF